MIVKTKYVMKGKLLRFIFTHRKFMQQKYQLKCGRKNLNATTLRARIHLTVYIALFIIE